MYPLVVVDFRVFVYNILNEFLPIKENRDNRTQQNWLKAAWAIYLNRGATSLPYHNHTVVIADDQPPYWRNKYLMDKGFPEYKGGRPDKPDTWYQVKEAGYDYIFSKNSPFYYIREEGYEADDVAGSIVRLSPKRSIFLHTIDTDWLGLVKQSNFDNNSLLYEQQEETQVLWANLIKWTPRLRGRKEAIKYIKDKLKRDVNQPREIWDVKVEKGDKSDNLIPGSPLEVIDLEAPPMEFDMLRSRNTKNKIQEIANSNVGNSNFDHLIKAKKWFEREGFPIPMFDFNLFPIKDD